jgi:hypothetical protein
MEKCPYKYVFGVPGTGFHAYRFLDTPIGDYLGTILLAMLVTWLTKIPLVITTIGAFVLGIILHMAFCMYTGSELWLVKIFS